MSKRVLIVDDDPHIREIIAFALEKEGMTTTMAADGAEALKLFEQRAPDFIVLDVGMPEMDGLEVCRRIRAASECPILFLSARDEEIDRIIGLEMGGDDYVTKPFSPRELVARVKAISKRATISPLADNDRVLEYGIVKLNTERRSSHVAGTSIELTETEFDMLAVLMRRPGVVFDRNAILDQAWGDNIHVSDRTIDSHMRNLRSKLKKAGCADAIRTVRGVGFQLHTCEGSTSI